MLKNLTNEIKIEAAESCLDLKEEADRVLKALAEAKKLAQKYIKPGEKVKTSRGTVRVDERVTINVPKSKVVDRLKVLDPNYNKFYAANKKTTVTKVVTIA
jgi:predicted RecB family endonuclease